MSPTVRQACCEHLPDDTLFAMPSVLRAGLPIIASLAVRLGSHLDSTASPDEIFWYHHRMYLNARIEGKEPWLGNRRYL